MRLFEILDKLNQQDAENGTAHVVIFPDIIAVDKKGNNGEVKVGIPGNIAQELVLTNMKGKSLILLSINLDEYNKIKNS